MPLPLGFQHSYRALPERFYAALAPTPVREPRLVAFNAPLARELGLDPGAVQPHAARIFSGNQLPPDASPLALAYAGHQFGHFVPQRGDGRAILLGELVDASGVRRDLQLKGAGRTPFSRGGDGRAALGPVLREYLVSEAMHALGIPTTRALAAVLTGEPVFRDDALPGAVLTRVAASHVRVGTFQYFAARGDTEGLRALADWVIARHYPEAAQADNPALALLAAVCERQAALVARWMMVGFVHGVMNTDNTTISGETIDYGPCAFMDAYHPETVFSSIDHQGRYAFANQPGIAQWNLTRLAECLLPLIEPDADRAVSLATEVIEAFAGRFQRHWTHGMRAKLGLATQEEGDAALASELLELLQGAQADYTLAFRRLCDA
ncbi:MAG: protein adenylyltransferase SelO, partial [Betaproteobacteria bacterium]